MRLALKFIVLLPLLLKAEAKPFLSNAVHSDANHLGAVSELHFVPLAEPHHEYGFLPGHGSSSSSSGGGSAGGFSHFGAPHGFQHLNYFHGPPAHDFDYYDYPDPHAHINSKFQPHRYPAHPAGWPQLHGHNDHPNHGDCMHPHGDAVQQQSESQAESTDVQPTISAISTITTIESSNPLFTAPLAPTTLPPSTVVPTLAPADASSSTIATDLSSTTDQEYGIDIRFGNE